MNPTKFCKFHGFGNDYIVIEKDELNHVSDIGKFSAEICHRHTGVGSDGIAVLERLDGTEADYYCEIVNPDGSIAGFSGNGTRCAVAYLYYKDLWNDKNLTLETKSGIKNYEFLKREENNFWYLAELGKPHSIRNLGSEIAGFEFENDVISLDVGNPVCAIFVDDFESLDWRKIGETLESFTEAFPKKTNVVFIKVLDKQNVDIRIWERGAAETSSSGTCSIAAAVASIHAEKTDRKVSVHAVGGTTEAVWREDDEMMITGSADLVFCGEWF